MQHLNGDNGMLVMVRWNIELPRLMPLVVESLKQLHQQPEKQQEERGVGGAIRTATAQTNQAAIRNVTISKTNSSQDISKQIVVVEDRPGLFFGSNNQRNVYPVLVMVKNSPFTNAELDLIKARVARNDAKVIAIPGLYIQPPYDKLLLLSSSSSQVIKNNQEQQGQQSSSSLLSYAAYSQQSSPFRMKPPTDDSPFYFAKEQIPAQLLLLLETVIGVSAVLAFLLIYYSKVNKIRLTASSRLHVVFVMLIGLGFIFLEITFIQKFLLLL
ncbi:MAG TPA: hypothetical protein VE593_04215, partial [Nitrososphaeraceae archaeon]|nr:hypothetical protein [Nitrososphaeraceae archaeon]